MLPILGKTLQTKTTIGSAATEWDLKRLNKVSSCLLWQFQASSLMANNFFLKLVQYSDAEIVDAKRPAAVPHLIRLLPRNVVRNKNTKNMLETSSNKPFLKLFLLTI